MIQVSWTAKDIRIITDNWGHMGYKEIAKILQRSPASLVFKARELGLVTSRQHSRMIDADDIKRYLLKGHTALEISVKLGCTKRRVNQIVTEDIPEYAALRNAIGNLRHRRAHM
jgi:DNA-binding CsgD family transcriptional regulator|tara:strand:+ start:765 stop:1106 length:342 start_codon:yes stop_codon:yes gene_type:complete